jgi:hypothetical protein
MGATLDVMPMVLYSLAGMVVTPETTEADAACHPFEPPSDVELDEVTFVMMSTAMITTTIATDPHAINFELDRPPLLVGALLVVTLRL